MAKWGKKGWRFKPSGGFQFNLFRGKSLRRVKTVSWGSGRSKSAPSRSSGAKWGMKPSASKPAAGWGSKGPSFSFGGQRVKKSTGSTWGARTREPRVRPRMKKRNVLLMFLLFMMVLSIPSFVFIEKNLRPPLMNIAKVRVKQVATQAINKAITEQVARKSESEKLIDWKMNGNGKISGFMLNYAEHMSITSQTIETVQSTLSEIKDIPEHIPIGHALNSAIISSFGPRVPVKFEPVGAVKVELSTRERNAAINMVLVEVYIKVVAEVSIIIPFDTEPEIVETEIPISYLLVVGDVPMYYYDSTGKAVGDTAQQAPNISVPLAPGSGVTSNSEESGKSTEKGTENSTEKSSESGAEGAHESEPPAE
ncbi:sporulation protein YunB [Paenibacillus sp. L3-i20]|uniref:sporulation protein YunB n=1 Tax=Paenibacillus sp. L3-i20 TaxID=2905833 RepID=UPI00208B6A72|nr:sporulation protein YunB [Paenibacillus sp. L3-i20]GKU76030.1 hypothetical protein L3i20_v204270 [Paenibacillus sp. L3-i20]